ncbi:Crm-domain containing factor cfm2 protein [Thalictrum thalictroides]|uniref:Crm-domain containing factor cfm2 protein n=1 Tax=Thalictrum thalictroides TaxID=46969 RepID=A0A7J6W3M7_THATH|nr:Crm-domain containing factor cfm2 protein [Thalictrum thalictroides]
MLLPFPTSLTPFSIKTHFSDFFPSPNLSPQILKPFKFTIHSSSTTNNNQTVSQTAIKRIADKLRSLGYIEEHKNSEQTQTSNNNYNSAGEIFLPFPEQLPKNRVGYTIDSSWSTPQNPLPEPGSGVAISRFYELKKEVKEEKKLVKKEPKVPTLAELKLSRTELKRLTTLGIALKKKLNVGKAGITEGIVNGIHERWRRIEVVKIKCEDLCKMNMKRTHETLERKTGGLVVWRAGSTIILYRGANYEYPYFMANGNKNIETYHVEASSESNVDVGVGEKLTNVAGIDGVNSSSPNHLSRVARPSLVHGVGSPNRVRFQLPGEAQLAEEADIMLDGLGPRFTDWWGYDPLPVDADLLPAIVPGYRRPFRLLPYGIKPKLTDDEMTTMRRLSRPLPCHFALGRNRRLQGLAVSIVKLWEKCEIAKIAIKRGVQNTNSDMMAEELKWLTGGTLLSRDREFITFYRGKDFLPAAVSIAIEDRRKHAVRKEKQLKGKTQSIENMPQDEMETDQIECDDELQETIQKNRELIAEERKIKSANSRLKRISTKLSMAVEKKEKAEQLLADLEKTAEPLKPEVDKEGITAEERYMLKKVGLRMKAYLPLGRRGVFDGTVENMHLHWKYRELVKIMASARSIEDAHAAARTLETESGGILIAVERVNREYAIIVYRGKNYQRPVDLRPQTLLNKKQAMKRSIEAQRRESLKLHVLKLTKNIDQLKLQLVKDDTQVSSPQPNDNTKSVTSDGGGGLVKYSCNKKEDTSMDSTDDQEASSCVDDPDYLEETIQLHRLMDTTTKYVGPVEIGQNSSSETKFRRKDQQSEVGDVADNESTSSTVRSLPQDGLMNSATDRVGECVSGNELIELSLEIEKEKPGPAVDRDVKKGSNVVVPFKATPLSNRDRLLLRKQALKMRKRPVIAIGRNNIVTGVAKTIKTHFEKNPLAIVNVKGRAEGTSVQEVIFKLEQATGAVLVSQETNKVILYRGWGMEEGQGHGKNKTKTRSMTGKQGNAQTVVSPQLLEAIRLECGLQINKEEGTL